MAFCYRFYREYMKIRAYPPPSGSSMWRMFDPFKYLQRKGIDAHVVDTGITEQDILDNDIFVINSVIDLKGLSLLYAYQQERNKKIVVDIDDWVEVNPSNPFKIEHELTNAPQVVTEIIKIANLVTTSTEYLAEKVKTLNSNVVILPNYPDLERWDTPKKFKNESKKIRIGWAGSITHMEDIKMIAPAIQRIMNEYKNVEFIFVGDTRIKQLFPYDRVECILGVPWNVWPTRLAGLRLDIGMAPLVHNEFNKCKSRIKFYEYAIAQIPGIYSPTVYDFQSFDGRFGLVATDVDHWYRCLKNMIDFPVLREDIANKAYGYVVGGARDLKSSHSLEKHIDEWIKAYSSVMN